MIDSVNFATPFIKICRRLRKKYRRHTFTRKRNSDYGKTSPQNSGKVVCACHKLFDYVGQSNVNSGWAQIECALPFSKPNRRPSFTVQRRTHESLVIAFKDIFEAIWNASSDTDQELMNEYEKQGKLSRGSSTPQLARCDTPIWHAVAHVRSVINDTDKENLYPETRKALRQAALNGEIKLRGRREIDAVNSKTLFSDVSSDVPSEYWKTSVINAMATAEVGLGNSHTNPETPYAWGPKGIYERNRYADLTADLQEVQRKWRSKG